MGFEPRIMRSDHTNDFKIGTHRLPCRAPGVIGLVLGLVGPVFV